MLQSDQIQDGDTVIIFEERKPKQMLTIQSGSTYQNKFGAFHHSSLIGQQYGAKIWSKSRAGCIQILRPNPFLITETVAHKTQILFQMDISMILLMLDIRPGKRVVESGTGSGSLSSSISQALKPSGKLFTYEFNEERAQNGQQLFKKLNFSSVATVFWRDVYGNGFLKIEQDNEFNKDKEFPTENTIDAIFLDLPQPWLALEHAKKMIKPGGRICNFSPCIEQVQRACQKLKEDGWKQIETIECLKRQFERRVKTETSLFEKRKKNQTDQDPQDQTQKQIKTNEGHEKRVFYSAGVPKAYGHTGYLTFAIMC